MSALTGVGHKIGASYNRLGLCKVRDLIFFLPTSGKRREKVTFIKDTKLPAFITIKVKVESHFQASRKSPIKVLVTDSSIDFEIIFNNPLIRTRRKEFKLSDDNLSPIYNSRTFCLYEDIDNIKKMGLAKGGSLDNAIVVQGEKILNEDGLRNRHEFVYHKILDCLGDIMLSGNRIFGHIKTSQGGHALTNKLLKKFFSEKSNWSFENSEKQNQNTYENPVAIGV